jgi:4-aminobutyrate aminotransferase
MWAVDHYDLEPDVITGAKGLRVGATVSREDVFPDEKSRLSSTWGAGAVLDSLYGVLTLDAIVEHDLMRTAVERGRSLRERLRDADLPGAVDVRGRGLMVAVEFDTKERREAVVEAAMTRGLLTLGCGHKTVRLLPPLDVTERELAMGVDLLAAAAEDAA